MGFLALATALSAVNPLYTPTKLYKGLKRPQIKAAAALVSNFTVEESVLKGEAAGLCELIDKCQGHLIAHVQSGDFWDCARVRDAVAIPLEFKVVHELSKANVALADYLNIEEDCGQVNVATKDWILMLGNKQRKRLKSPGTPSRKSTSRRSTKALQLISAQCASDEP